MPFCVTVIGRECSVLTVVNDWLLHRSTLLRCIFHVDSSTSDQYRFVCLMWPDSLDCCSTVGAFYVLEQLVCRCCQCSLCSSVAVLSRTDGSHLELHRKVYLTGRLELVGWFGEGDSVCLATRLCACCCRRRQCMHATQHFSIITVNNKRHIHSPISSSYTKIISFIVPCALRPTSIGARGEEPWVQ